MKSVSEKVSEAIASGKNKISEMLDGLEVKPFGQGLLVKPYDKNPYNNREERDSGIILDDETPTFKNPDSGEDDIMEAGILVGKVIETGPDVKYVQVGDDIYFTVGSVVPIPFLRQGLVYIAESRSLVVVNKNLSKRK